MFSGCLRSGCFMFIAFSSMVMCRTVIKQPPWIRAEAMPEILYRPGATPQIIRVLCPTISGDHANVTWWRGSEQIAAGEELLFRPLESHHVGKYHCEARNEAGLSRSQELEVNLVYMQVVTPSVQRLFLMEGQAASIACAAPEGYPTPTLFWNNTQPDHTIQMIVDPEGTLHLPYIASRDHGLLLECSVRHLTETYVIKIVELVVHPRPQECHETARLLYATQNILLKKHSDALIYCVPSGPPASISWTVFLHDAKAAIREDAEYLLRINSSTLAVDERMFRVTCRVAGSGLESVITVTLASEPSILPMRNVSKLEGEEVSLKCHATGEPKPSIEWYFNNEPIEKRKLIENNIVLPHVNLNDTGIYRCEAFNQFGRTYQELSLSVNTAKPHILADTDCYETVVGDRLSVPCDALAFREPTRTWFKNGTVIKGTLDDETLHLVDVQLDDAGHYACRVCEKQPPELPCSIYEFEVKVSLSQFLETPKKPIVVPEDGALNISCIPRFVEDAILWRIDGVFNSRGRTLHLEKPQAGTYSCELRRNETLVTQWDGSVSLRRKTAKIRITEISCRVEDVGFLKWTPVEDAAFYEILLSSDARRWQSVEFVKGDTSSRIRLGGCNPCRFRVRSHNEAGSMISESQQCEPAQVPGPEDIRLLVSNITINREAHGVHVSWNTTKKERLCYRVCIHPSKICQDTYGTEASFNLSSISPKSPFTVAYCQSPNDLALEAHYNCNLTLEITEIRHRQLGSVEISWSFDSDPCCSLMGRLIVDNSTSHDVRLRRKRFLLENLESNRMYCLKLVASYEDRVLQQPPASEACFIPGQGWEVLRGGPLKELRDGGSRITVPNDTLLLYSIKDKFELFPSNRTSVDVKSLGEASIRFVQKLNGHCRVSNIMFLGREENSDWYLWLCGLVIVVGGVAITAAMLFRKRSTFYKTGFV